MTNRDHHVLIVGAGNCGLAVATGLTQHGIENTVFERDSEHDYIHKTRDWGMLLHWGTEYLSKILPEILRNRVREIRVDPDYEMTQPIPHLDAVSGKVLREVETPVINRVSRRKLRKFLTENGKLNIEFGKQLQSIEIQDESVQLSFEDGSSVVGALIIGADGSHSKVREFLVGQEAARPESLNLSMINFPYGGYTAEQARLLRSWHPIVQLCYNPKQGGALLAALDIADPEDPTSWKFQNYTSWWGPPYAADLEDPAVRLKFYKQRVSSFCDPFRTAALGIADGTVIQVYPGNQWAPTMKWDNRNGRVTIAGDAAHSMLPHRGQGLNNTMKDASDLVDAIRAITSKEKTSSEAIAAYEDEMRPRGVKEVELSYEQAKATRTWEALQNSPIAKHGLSRIS